MKFKQLLHRLMQNWPAKIMSLAAAIFLFLFHTVTSLEERYFTVPLHLTLADGYVVSGSFPSSVRVTLRGNNETVYRIMEEDIRAFADFSSHSSEGMFRAAVNFQRRGNAAEAGSLEITVEPREVTLEIEKKIRKTVEVFPNMTGYPAKGYELAQYFVNPSTVQVEGPRSHLENLSTVLTDDIDLTGRTGDFTQKVSLSNQDSFLVFPGGSSVEFLGLIRETVISRSFTDVGMVLLDLDERLVLAEPMGKGSIKIQGPQLVLESLTPEDLFISVDCSGLRGPGTYGVEARPEVPPGVNVLSWSPETLQLRVIPRAAAAAPAAAGAPAAGEAVR